MLPSKFLLTIKRGDVFRLVLAGGGGYGDSLERDPALVLRDVIEEKITPAHAREGYGVVVTGDPPEIDWDASKRLREQRGAEGSPRPSGERGGWRRS